MNTTLEATGAPSGSGTATGTAGRVDGSSTVTAVQPLAPRYASADDAALGALRDLAASDRSSVLKGPPLCRYSEMGPSGS